MTCPLILSEPGQHNHATHWAISYGSMIFLCRLRFSNLAAAASRKSPLFPDFDTLSLKSPILWGYPSKNYPIFNMKWSKANRNRGVIIQGALRSCTTGTLALQSCSECCAGFIPPCSASMSSQTTDFRTFLGGSDSPMF